MDKYVFDGSNGLWYELIGDYYIPCLTLPAEEEQPIGIWGQRHLHYLKEYHRLTYTNLLTNGRLNEYLAEIDKQAKDMFFRLVKEYADRQGVTEQLKADKPLEWVQRMNNIRNAVGEVVNAELIYA
ncbi:TnpV protein [Eshraghiella crossota]|uniref:TnpV protein n=1 Tax=Eshraghiella crossota TaxID=45851 RepID=UPI0009683CCF|nr:MAG: TnpV protein [Butyrivibrio crossotus]